MAKKERLHLKQADMIRLADMLRKVCVAIDGYAVYEDGFDDYKMVDLYGTGINVDHVKRMRISLIGPIREARSLSPKELTVQFDKMVERVAELEKLVYRLGDWASVRPVQGFKVKP